MTCFTSKISFNRTRINLKRIMGLDYPFVSSSFVSLVLQSIMFFAFALDLKKLKMASCIYTWNAYVMIVYFIRNNYYCFVIIIII